VWIQKHLCNKGKIHIRDTMTRSDDSQLRRQLNHKPGAVNCSGNSTQMYREVQCGISRTNAISKFGGKNSNTYTSRLYIIRKKNH